MDRMIEYYLQCRCIVCNLKVNKTYLRKKEPKVVNIFCSNCHMIRQANVVKILEQKSFLQTK